MPATPPVDTAPPDSLGRRTARSVLWMVAQKWAVRVGGLVTVAILARLLAPEDFGLLAAASTVVTLVYVLSDLGFSTYLVQATVVTRTTLSTAFWFSLAAGGVLAALVVTGAPLFAGMLGIDELTPILRVLSLSVVFISLTSVPLAILRRRMAFRTIALQEVTAAILAQVVAVAAAFGGLGVWALVCQMMTAQVVTAIFVWVAAGWVPAPAFSRAEFAVMARFGSQVVANGMISVVRVWAETAIIVGALGVRELGYLNIGQRLVQAATELSVSALLPVTTVAFSQARTSLARLRAAYLRGAAVTHALVTPLMVFLAVTAPVLVPLFFGSAFSASAPVTRLLAVAAFLTLGVSIDHGLHYGLGRPGRWLVFTLGIYTLAVAVTAVAVTWGLTGVVAAFVGTALVETVGRWGLSGRLLGMRARLVAMPFLAMLVPASVSGLAALLTMRLLADLPPLVVLGAAGAVLVLVHAVAVRVLAPRTFADVVALLPRRTRQVRSVLAETP